MNYKEYEIAPLVYALVVLGRMRIEQCHEYENVGQLRCTCVHYNDVIMTTMASQITSLTVVYSTIYSDADQRKHQSSASLAFVWGIHRDRWIPRTKGQLRGKCFHLMTSSCYMRLLGHYQHAEARRHMYTSVTWVIIISDYPSLV